MNTSVSVNVASTFQTLSSTRFWDTNMREQLLKEKYFTFQEVMDEALTLEASRQEKKCQKRKDI